MSTPAPTLEEPVARLESNLAATDSGAKRNVNRIDTQVAPDLRREIVALEKRVADLEQEVRRLRPGNKNKSGVRP